MFTLVFVACQAPSSDPSDADPDPIVEPTVPSTPTSTTPWTVPDTEPPPFDSEALGHGLDGAITTLLTLDAGPALASYDEIMQYGSPGCPYTYGTSTTYYGYDNWYSQCETPSESTFSGYAGLYTSQYGGGYLSQYLYASATVLTRDGATWSASGYWSHTDNDYGGYRSTYEELNGVYAYDGPAAEGTWIEDQVQAAIVIGEDTARSGNWHTLGVDGQVTGLRGDIDTVDFVDVTFDSRDDCREPNGTIAVRTPDGDWFDVAFREDGTDECDGCGLARWRGLEMGEVCGDFSPWEAP